MNCTDNCHSDQNIDCIHGVPIFAGMTQDEIIEIAGITTAKTYDRGEMVYMAGDTGGKLYVLHTGRVKIFRLNANGREQMIRVVGPGEFMGELSLFSSLPLTDNAQVTENCTMCVIEGTKLRELMAKYASIAFKVMDVLSRRLEEAENLIEAINLTSAEQRLAQTLLNMSAESADAGGKEVVLNMTKGDLASRLGMTQETLSRRLTAFQDEGLIRLKGRTIIIADRTALEGYAT
ncbi:MAG: Crp/Fnr family transcriptional regulator [Eubacteriales bacterium]|jgi:CRP-like cAMP-binding protein|nr:Crp/Fnr family transcriptional regulator [Eubacteriales bacterium]